MTTRELTSFEHILLGVLAGAPCSGYDLKKLFSSTPASVYEPSSGAIYPALRRLEARGLLRARPLPSLKRRDRVVYEPTDAGRQAHLNWLRQPVNSDTVAKDLATHQMRFVMMERALPREEVARFLEDLARALRVFIDYLEAYLNSGNKPPGLASEGPAPFGRMALQHGVAVHRASLAWVEHTLSLLGGRANAPVGASAHQRQANIDKMLDSRKPASRGNGLPAASPIRQPARWPSDETSRPEHAGTPEKHNPSTGLASLLRGARAAHWHTVSAHLAQLGFGDLPTNGQFVLEAVPRSGAPVVHIARALDVTRQAATQLVKALTARGYLACEADEKDRRRLHVTLTPRGLAAAAALRDADNKVEAELAHFLPASTLSALKEGLGVLAKSSS